ncbi:polysaccharide export outer membrane protein [Cyclobacterium lianum]|uniref:Polysaccharide export outer membrane protein n=1 Tax=Cyclobacterium lianum TaxID=388280 RepID=A0A1M7NSY0_9BACT|nr:polysaccharide biosynthesis/export family protein [Cyclobacterium lianum]SHN07048.1 polysaccharide export outer membrane protein [Cyclobacterium lianum]
MKILKFLLFAASVVSLTASCISNERIIYLQETDESIPLYTEGELVPNSTEEYYLQYNDVVDINIKTTSPELNEIFGIAGDESVRMNMAQGAQNGGDIFFINGYTVDENGQVELPLLGEIDLLGLTTKQAQSKIESQLRAYVNEEDFFVRVRLGGVRFSALGEFNRSGNFTILQNRISIFQAIAHAGDMTTTAKRNEVVLIRQYPEGTKSFRINLNDKRIVESEFYFIRPNDLLYAEPMKIRELGTGVNFVQTFQLAVTTLSAVLLVLNAIR